MSSRLLDAVLPLGPKFLLVVVGVWPVKVRDVQRCHVGRDAEAVFQRLKGVKTVASGYAGGDVANPTYKQVCTGETGHAEVVQLEFDPSQVSFETLLKVFWAAHDPTTLNRPNFQPA